MQTAERIKNWKLHDSMRGQFGLDLYKAMASNPNIMLVTGDLGFGLFDNHRDDFPDRFFNVGAAEQAGIGICCGMALRGKTPIFYSITNFALYRPFEFIRNYVDYEQIPVIIVGGGRDDDYKHDGISHISTDAHKVLECFPSIQQFWPLSKDAVAGVLKDAIESRKPAFISLKR